MFSASKTAAPVSGGYQVSNSLRFRASASAYLNRTPASAGNRQTWTWSGWVKRGTLGAPQVLFDCDGGVTDTTFGIFGFTGSDTFEFLPYEFQWRATTQVFRDPSAWYHLVVAFDTTQAVAANRIKIYLNGTQITAFSVSNNPTQNASYGINQAAVHNIAKLYGGRGYFDGYMAEVNFIDGQALTPSSFGSINATTGVWQPARYTGSYGTNGFYLKFNNGISTTTLGNDSSGNNNNWTTNNISLTAGSTYDWMIDSPTSYAGSSYGVGNYCVMNAVSIGSDCTLSDGNLGVAYGSSGTIKSTMATIGMSSGKWYCEFSITGGSSPSPAIGISSKASASDMPEYIGYTANGWGYYIDGTKRNNAVGGGSSAYGATWTTGDIIGIAFDANAGSLTFYKNGTSQGVAFTGLTSGPYYFGVGDGGGVPTFTSWFNFGQRPFAYTPPSGFKSICTQNLPAPAIYNGANHMAATTYTGNGSTQSISNAVNSVSFQPGLVWIKNRSGTNSHQLADSVRGVTKYLFSDAMLAEETRTNQITAFSSTGFSLDSGAAVNTSANNFVGWQWKAGGTAVTNTSGSIISQVSANTTAGFSVVTYTGTGSAATIGHGLGVAPSFVIVKWRSGGSNQGWPVYHVTQGNQAYLALNSTAAVVTSYPTMWNSTTPTSTVFSVGTGETWTNNSAWTYVAYCFAAIAGYSAFGSYTGNGSADGPFVYCGFRPRFIMLKSSSIGGSAGYDWIIQDTARSPINLADQKLTANTANAENIDSGGGSTSGFWYDILSNGFKIRNAGGGQNANGSTYIYAAFAESPFSLSLAR